MVLRGTYEVLNCERRGIWFTHNANFFGSFVALGGHLTGRLKQNMQRNAIYLPGDYPKDGLLPPTLTTY